MLCVINDPEIIAPDSSRWRSLTGRCTVELSAHLCVCPQGRIAAKLLSSGALRVMASATRPSSSAWMRSLLPVETNSARTR